MAKTPTLLSLFSLTNTILVLLNMSLVNSNGLTMKLLHPNSPESPLFRTNLSHEKRIKVLASQSNMHANYLSNSSSPNIHAQIDVQLFHYIIKIGIGTFKSKPPYKEYYLEMDTGSSLIWLQCDGCTKCFNLTPKPFPKEKSSSFRPITDQNKHLTYECKYHDGDTTHGIQARETFYLKTKTGLSKIENIQFGCGLYNVMKFGDYKNNKIAGIMGLGWDDISFVKQLGYKSNGKFSYCLPVVISGKAPSSYLRFDDDINIAHKKNLKSTPLYRRKKPSLYYVEMQGISINRTRLNINPQVFAYKNNNNTSGCIIDTGTPYSRIIAPAFDILKLELEKYFSRLKGIKKTKSDLGLELCYERNRAEGFKNLPDITFHLQGSQGDFILKAEAAFEVVSRSRLISIREYICLAMVRDNEKSTIGAHQQTNHRIIHDTKNKQLVFYPEDCSKSP